MAKKQTPFQKTTLHSFFASPDKKQAVAGPSRGVSSSRKAGGSKDQPVELSSSDDDEDCKPGPSVPPPRKRSRTSQAQSLSGIKVEETVVASGVGKAREAQRPLLASAAEASVDDDDKIEPVVIDSSPVLAFDDDGEGVAGFYAVPSPLPKVPSCRDPSPDWPDDADDAKEPFDVDGLPDLVHGGADDELGNLMNDDEQGSQLDPDEDDEELDEVGLGDGDEMARHTGGLGDDGEDEDGSEVECVEAQDDHKKRPTNRLSSIRHSLPPTGPSVSSAKPTAPNAFSMLMAKKPQSIWEAVEDDRSIKQGGKVMARGERRKAPFFKVMSGMPVCVDGFRYGKIPKVTAYLLSHAHSDHYTRLSKAWNSGPIYCSQTTANLITRVLGVERKWVVPLEYNAPTVLPNTGGVICTMIEANHCPGSALFLFEGKRTVNAGDSPYPVSGVGSARVWRYLHCGDFRACPKIVLHPEIAKAPLDEVYLDTTYLNPHYCFPPQPVVINSVSKLAKTLVLGDGASSGDASGSLKAPPAPSGLAKWVTRDESEAAQKEREDKARLRGSRTLVAVGTYSIGKERIVKGIAQALGSRIFADARKRGLIADQVEDPVLHALMTSKSDESQVHMISLHDINPEGLANHLGKYKDKYDRIIGFRPTGWTFGGAAGTTQTPDLATLIERDRVASEAFDAKDIKPMRGSSDRVMMLGVPYSEHSSFTELTCFCLSVPGEPRIIPTVNVGSAKSREKMDVWIKRWATEKRKRQAVGLNMVDYRSLDYW